MLTHWFYLYIPWFFPFVAITALASAPVAVAAQAVERAHDRPPESWSRQADPLRAALVAVAALVLFLTAWGLLHVGFYTRDQVVDTPIYQRYGDAMAEGQVPYRDFALEYPPGALPVFVLPSLAADRGDQVGYERAFEVLMWLCGAGLLAAMVGVLDGLGATPRRAAGALASRRRRAARARFGRADAV